MEGPPLPPQAPRRDRERNSSRAAHAHSSYRAPPPGVPGDIADQAVPYQRRSTRSKPPPPPGGHRSHSPLPRSSSPLPMHPPSSPRRPPSQPRAQRAHRERKFDADFDRRLPLPSQPPADDSARKLFDPSAPPSPPTTSRGQRAPPPPPTAPSRQLFDPRRDDPVRFSLLKRGADHVSATSTSASSFRTASTSATTSHPEEEHERQRDKERERRKRAVARSQSSSKDSNSRSSSGSGSKKDSKRHEAEGGAFVAQLKRAYRDIMDTESRLAEERKVVGEGREGRIGVLGKEGAANDSMWIRIATKHKNLADAYHFFLQTSLAPHTPASLHALPQKYNIPTRLWQNAFHGLLERMRASLNPSPSSSSSTSTAAAASGRRQVDEKVLDHLTDFIYHAYSFYTNLLEEPTLSPFRTSWIEALGDLARYRMAVASLSAQLSGSAAGGSSGSAPSPPPLSEPEPREARIDDSEPAEAASIGLSALAQGGFDVEERETWRGVARDWYGKGLREMPGTGRLHHHLGILCRGSSEEGEDLRGLYHLAKSLTTSHPYVPARESILALFDPALQATRTAPDASSPNLFVHLHGLLFTRIQLDDFPDALARFLERLEAEFARVPESTWMMMAIINMAGLLQYGADDGLVKKSEDAGNLRRTRREDKTPQPQAIMIHAKSTAAAAPEGELEVDEHGRAEVPEVEDDVEGEIVPLTERVSIHDEMSIPIAFKHAQLLAFSVLALCLRQPRATSLPGAPINPYITVFLTFLSTIFKQPSTLALLERAVPWSALVDFLNRMPKDVGRGLASADANAAPGRLISGAPLPEDFCVRGMEWVGRKVYERGFWKARSNSGRLAADTRADAPPPIPGTAYQSEMEVLWSDRDGADPEALLRDGIIDDAEDGPDSDDPESPLYLAQRRWRRVAFLANVLARHVSGFALAPGRGWAITGRLEAKIAGWRREREEKEEAERRRVRELYARAESDEEDVVESQESQDEEEDEDDSEEIRELKARRRELRRLMRENKRGESLSARDALASMRSRTDAARQRLALNVVAGFTILVFDTNILLSSLPMFSDFVESTRWTVVIPLAVVTELDGIKLSPTPLGAAAASAISYLERRIKTHAKALKVMTSKYNYLSDLRLRSEDLGPRFGNDGEDDRFYAHTMDDLILRAAVWQREHFVDRSHLLRPDAPAPAEATTARVVLVTFDRNLRLKARAEGVQAADEREMARLWQYEKEAVG